MSEASASRDPLRDAMRDLELVMEWRTDYIRKHGEALDEIARLTEERDRLRETNRSLNRRCQAADAALDDAKRIWLVLSLGWILCLALFVAAALLALGII